MIPSSAKVTVNHRVHPGNTLEEVRIFSIRLVINAFYTKLNRSLLVCFKASFH